jgi:CDP-4-dehydro-6-deoxyglucose reductase
MAGYTAVVTGAELLSPEVRSVTFSLRDTARFDFTPGQFVSLAVPLPELGADRLRSYSIASPPDGGASLEIAVARVAGGHASRWLHEVRPGAEVRLTGPYGFFTLESPPAAPLCFVATGTGVTPIRPMLRRVFEIGTPHDVTLIFGCRFEADVIWRAEFEALAARHDNFRFLPTLSSPGPSWAGSAGYVQQLLQRTVIDPRRAETEVYVCGLKRMVGEVVDRLKGAGWPRGKIHQERYD